MSRVRHLLIGLASSSALYSSLAPALGLGEITLHSALNQPLEADIQLLQVGDLNAGEIKVKLASVDVFNRSGVERFIFLNDLRFTPLLSGGRNIIRVTSNQAVREPYLNFIVEVSRPNGQLLREYTVLLDPPTSSAYRSVSTAPSSQYTTSPAPRSAPAPAPQSFRPQAPSVMPAAELGQAYQVRSGDSMWKIAATLRSQGSTASQQALMNDIYALNPQAFVGGDINRLSAGADLRLPDSAVTSAPATASTNSTAMPAVDAASVAPTTASPAEAATAGAPASGLDSATSAGSVAVTDAAAGAQSAPAALDVQAENLAQMQRRLDMELASQSAESLQLQQSLAELQDQLKALQAQVAAKDEQLSQLQSQSAAAPAASVNAANTNAPAVVAEQPSGWMSYVYGLLGLLLAALLALFWRSKREKTPPKPASVEVVMPASAEPLSVFDKPVVVKPARAPALAVVSSRTETPVDALEGANLYITYGRYNEAVAGLRKALVTQPERNDIRFRLLEVLAMQGDTQGFIAEEAVLREANFTPERIDQLKARYPQLLENADIEPLDLDDVLLDLDEQPAAQKPTPVSSADEDYQLNLDDLSLDADWDLVSPFSPKAKPKVVKTAYVDIGSNLSDLPGVEELPHDDEFGVLNEADEAVLDAWLDDEPKNSLANVDDLADLDALGGSKRNVTKLNQALAYIEQGSIESACDILNEVLHDGDDEEKQEARELLAKIA